MSETPQGVLENWIERVAATGQPWIEGAMGRSSADGRSAFPLYGPGNAPARGGEGVAGAAPFVRGADPLPREVGPPWTLAPRVAAPDPGAANAELLAELGGGAEGAWLVFDSSLRSGGQVPIAGDGLCVETAADLRRALQGVLLDGIELHLDAGAATGRLLPMLERLATEAGFEPLNLQVHANHDPAEELLRFGAASLEAEAPAHLFGGRRALISGECLSSAGADAVDVLAYLLCVAADRLRRAEAAGGDPAVALDSTGFRVALDTDLLGGVVQLRALRGVVSALRAACGLPAAAARVHAVTSRRTQATIDPWSNLLRGSYQTLAAVLGGADAITTLPFDAAAGRGSAAGRAIARNLHHVLAREAHLGRVVDPLGGAYAVEQRTAELEAAAWARFRELERGGGLEALLAPGALEAWIAPARERRSQELARRRRPLLGVTRHVVPEPASPPPPDPPSPRVGEALAPELVAELRPAGPLVHRVPLEAAPDAGPFEALRAATESLEPRPRAFLANLGRLRDHKARAVFAGDTLAVAGLATESGAGTPTVSGGAVLMQVLEQYRASGAEVACVCGSDEDYAEHGRGVVAGLAAAGARAVLLTAKPGADAEAWREAGLTDFVHLGSDLLDLFQGVFARLDAAPAEVQS